MFQSKSHSLAHLFSEAKEACLETSQKNGSGLIESYAVGPYELCFHLAHAGMTKFISAFQHLPRPERSEKKLTFYLWDSNYSGRDFPFLPEHDRGENGAPQRYSLNGDCRFLYNFFEGNISCQAVDFNRDEAVFWTKDYETPFYGDAVEPLFSALTWWMRARGLSFAHAGAIGENGQGLLIPGGSGSGKTTTCLTSLLGGMDFLGDDHAVLDLRDPVSAYSLYHCVKLLPDSLSRFEGRLPDPLPHLPGWNAEKHLLFLKDRFADQLKGSLTLRGIVFPRVTGCAGPRLKKISAGESLRLLAPSTVLQFSDPSSRDLAELANLVKRLPCRVLELGANMEAVPELLKTFLTRGDKS